MGSLRGSAGLFAFFVLVRSLEAQSGVITTIAGTTPLNGAPVRGFNGDGRPAAETSLALANLQNDCDPVRYEQTSHISLDAKGNLYVADSNNQRIRRISTDGLISTITGNGERPAINARCEPTAPVGDGGPATAAQLFNPSDVVLHPNGDLIIVDQQNNRIRQVSPAGVITTIAGSGLHNLYAPGIPATSSPMDWPSSLAVNAGGLVFFVEVHSNRVGRISVDGRISTVAGTGFPGFNADNIAANAATLRKPMGIAFDAPGNLFIADTGNHRIRKVSPAGIISTIAGTGQAAFCGDGGKAAQACLDTPMDVKADALGNIYIADTGNHRVRKIDPSGVITTVAGTGQPGRGSDAVAAIESALNSPSALAVDSQNDLYIVDWQNYLIRKVSFRMAPVVAAGGVVNAASFSEPIAPGSIISIFGTNLAGTTALATGAPWPLSLGGVSVQLNGTAIPVYSVSPNQVNAQLPFGIEPGSASLAVVSSVGTSNSVTVTVARSAPGIFYYPGSDRAIALNQNGSLNAADNPEDRGRVVVCFLTGVGAVDPAVGTGQLAPTDVLSRSVLPVTATVGGLPAQVLFLGLAPGFIGLGQVNILAPSTVTAGDRVSLSIEVGGQQSNIVSVSLR
jgi:uncharacterized protein (TIGR03437 family)